MTADSTCVEFLEGEARACAEGIWETQGPGLDPFRAEEGDFESLPEDVLESLEMDLNRPLDRVERRAMEAAFRRRISELLDELIIKASRIRARVKASAAAGKRGI